MKDLIKRSYEAIKARGLIDNHTTQEDFYIKMVEELKEFYEAIRFDDNIAKKEEVTDLMTVCCMYLVNIGVDPIQEFEKVVIKNEKRALQRQRKTQILSKNV